MSKEHDGFWWSEWGRKGEMKMQLTAIYPFMWIGTGLILSSHFSINPMARYILIIIGISCMLSATFITYNDYKHTKDWLKENE